MSHAPRFERTSDASLTKVWLGWLIALQLLLCAVWAGLCVAQPIDVGQSAPGGGVQVSAPRDASLPASLPLKRDTVLAERTTGRAWALFGLVAFLFAGVFVYRMRASDKGMQTPKWMRRIGVSFAESPIRIVHSLRLTPRASLHLVRWNDQEWLLGCSESGMLLVGQASVPRRPSSDEGGSVDQCDYEVLK